LNNNIKKFAKQAGYSGGFDDPQEFEQIGDDFSYFDIEKFAELIVTECAKVCSEQPDPQTLNYKPSEKFAHLVKTHFGVK